MSNFVKGFYNPQTHRIVRIMTDHDYEIDQDEYSLGVRAFPWTKYNLGHDHAEDNLRELITRVNGITEELITDPDCPTCNGTGWADNGMECSACDGTGEAEGWIDLWDYSFEDLVKLVIDGAIDKENKYIAWLPVYIYDHSGITINTTGFSCRWDSGRIGIVYTSLLDDNDDLPIPQEGESILEAAERVLRSEIKYIDQIITGSVYGFQEYAVDEDGDYYVDDSCWGFVGELTDDIENKDSVLPDILENTTCLAEWKEGKLIEIGDDMPDNILRYAPNGETTQARLAKFHIYTDNTTAGVMCTDSEGFYLFPRPLKLKQLLSLLALLEKGESRTLAIQVIGDEMRGDK